MVATEKRVLVVDDEEIVRESCRRSLTEAGYAVYTAGSGRDALKACRSGPFDVMLTDLKMPEMDGLEVARAVREEFPDVRVVVITGYPSRESAAQAERLGTFDYLEKPLSPERLSAATAAALARPWSRMPAVAEVEAPASDAPGTTEAPGRQPKAAPAPQADPATAQKAVAQPTETLERAATGSAVRLAVAGAVGFLAGVVVAYAIAPSQGLAYLAAGTAIASGTVFGLFSDSFRSTSERSSSYRSE